MKISKVRFQNFKPYYGKVDIDLSTSEGKNLVLIGGRNGQGKTSFLVGIVWCLYGENLSSVDKTFKDEVKGTYTKFLNKSLNWVAKDDGNTKFAVEIVFTGVELSDAFTTNQQLPTEVTVRRSYDSSDPASGENFDILMDGESNALLSDETDRINFINDYLIPIDIAKFVFFDAEKIAEIASLGVKDQAAIMDEAFGQILGLDTYSNLIEDLRTYERNLQKEAASHDINLQIASFEGGKKQNDITIEANENRLNEIEEEIERLKIEITEFTNQLIRRGDASVKVDVNELRLKEEKLNEQLEEAGQKFNDLSDLIPFAVMGHKLEEAVEHINQEDAIKRSQIEQKVIKEKTRQFADALFNRSPLPPDEEDINFEQKSFYYQKAKGILSSLYNDEQDDIFLGFEHDLDKSDVRHIQEVFELTKQYSKNSFEGIFNEYIRTQNDYQEVLKELRMAEASSKDEFIQQLQDDKNEAEREKSRLEQEKGKLENEQVRLVDENKKLQTNIDNRLNKVRASKKIDKKLKVVRKYIKVLNEFIKTQKEQKKNVLENSLLKEINILFNKTDLVDRVSMTILKSNLGLEVKLYDDVGRETNPNSDMSKGEQQLYISALLKAILAESIHDLPVFIDTPLGRLDQEHRNNILEHYYPFLSEQIVIFSTNTEIRVADLPKIESYIAKKYCLENIDKKTIVHSNYFS